MGQIAHALLTRPPLELSSSSRNLPISIPARLACVKHAASVRPEPGSNSYVQSIILIYCFLQDTRQSIPFSSANQAFTLSESDCSFLLDLLSAILANFSIRSNRLLSQLGNLPVPNRSLYRFQGSRCRFSVVCTAVLATTLMIIAKPLVLVKRFLQVYMEIT